MGFFSKQVIDGQVKRKCLRCGELLRAPRDHSTSNMINHLKSKGHEVEQKKYRAYIERKRSQKRDMVLNGGRNALPPAVRQQLGLGSSTSTAHTNGESSSGQMGIIQRIQQQQISQQNERSGSNSLIEGLLQQDAQQVEIKAEMPAEHYQTPPQQQYYNQQGILAMADAHAQQWMAAHGQERNNSHPQENILTFDGLLEGEDDEDHELPPEEEEEEHFGSRNGGVNLQMNGGNSLNGRKRKRHNDGKGNIGDDWLEMDRRIKRAKLRYFNNQADLAKSQKQLAEKQSVESDLRAEVLRMQIVQMRMRQPRSESMQRERCPSTESTLSGEDV